MIRRMSHAIAAKEHMTNITCQFSAYLRYSEIFSLFQLKSCFDLKMAASCLSIICTNTLSWCAYI